jgi:hypothetical protein
MFALAVEHFDRLSASASVWCAKAFYQPKTRKSRRLIDLPPSPGDANRALFAAISGPIKTAVGTGMRQEDQRSKLRSGKFCRELIRLTTRRP